VFLLMALLAIGCGKRVFVDAITDAGDPVTDAGAPVTDAGDPVTDAGDPVTDAGDPVTDAGDPGPDAGDPITDAGDPVTDAGMPIADAGAPFYDAGPSGPGSPYFDGGVACPLHAASGSEATTVQIDAAHTGAQPGDALTLPLCQRWSRNFGTRVSPAMVSEGRVFVATRDSLYALAEETGETLWGPVSLAPPPNGIDVGWPTPALDRGRVYIVRGGGLVEAFDQATGAQLWSTQLKGQNFFLKAAPVAVNGLLFASGDGGGATIYALDGLTGSLLWSAIDNGSANTPTIGSGVLVMSYACGLIYARMPATGNLLWRTHPPCEGGGSGITPLFEGRVYTIESRPPEIVDVATGAQLGTFTSYEAPAFLPGEIFTVPYNYLVAGSIPSMTQRWATTPASGGYSAPLVIGDRIVTVSSTGPLLVLDAATGAQVGSVDLRPLYGTVPGSVAPFFADSEADGMLFVSVGFSLVAY
jgi:outer membrane protein assembly factor BamB